VASELPPSLLSALADLGSWLDVERIPSMVIGGVAASILGRPSPASRTCCILLSAAEYC
jgi:hypothetical protein